MVVMLGSLSLSLKDSILMWITSVEFKCCKFDGTNRNIWMLRVLYAIRGTFKGASFDPKITLGSSNQQIWIHFIIIRKFSFFIMKINKSTEAILIV